MMRHQTTGDIDVDAYYELMDQVHVLRVLLVLTWLAALALTALVVLS